MWRVDFEQAGLLDGLEGADRDAREQLLQQLADDGVSLDELEAAVAEDRLALLPVERVLGGRYTAAEIEERSGLPADLLLKLRGLLGLPVPDAQDRLFADLVGFTRLGGEMEPRELGTVAVKLAELAT